MHLFLRRAVLLFASLVAAYPPPEACTGWCYEDLRDPAVVYKNGTYYRFTTHHNFTIATAPSITGPWEMRGSALRNGSTIKLPMPAAKNGDVPPKYKLPALWAPDVLLINDTYYMTYTVTRGGRPNDIGVATSKTLEPDSWEDHGSIGLVESPHNNRIDSNLFQHSPDGQPLLSFGSYLRGIYQIPFGVQRLKTTGEPALIAHNASYVAMEASYQFQWTVNGTQWYYLFFSSGRCCNAPSHLPPAGDEYKVEVCRSDLSTGPFVDENDRPCIESGGKMVLGSQGDIYGPGGQGVMYDEQLMMPIMYYHYMKRSTGYHVKQVYFGWNKLSFDSGWPELVGKDMEVNNTTSGNTSSAVSRGLGSSEWLSFAMLLLAGLAVL